MAIPFDEQKILQYVSSTIYQRGKRYFKQNRVKILRFEEDFIHAQVYGSTLYDVEFQIRNSIVMPECSCPYFQQGFGICKHVVAVWLEANRYSEEKIQASQKSWKMLLQSGGEKSTKKPERKTKKLVFKLQMAYYGWDIIPKALYIKKDGTLGREMSVSASDFENGNIVASEKEQVAANFFLKEQDGYYYYDKGYHFQGAKLGYLFDLLKESEIYDQTGDPIKFYPNPLSVKVVLKEKKKDYDLSLHLTDSEKGKTFQLDDSFYLLTSGKVFLHRKGLVYELREHLSKDILLPFTKTRQPLQIPQKEMKQFIEYALARMQPQNIPIEWPASFDFQILDQLVKKTLILREVEGELYFDLQFEYSAEQENAPLLQVDGLPFKPVKIIQGAKKNYVVQRQQKVEEAQINFLLANRLKITDDGLAFTLKNNVNPFDWLFNTLPEIAKHGFEVLGEENLEKLKIKRVTPKIISKVTSDLDWFDLNVELDFDGLRVSYFEISKALKSKKKYIRLTDGSAVRLDEKTLKKLGLISHFAQKVPGKDELRLSKTQALVLDEILKSSSSAKSDKVFKQQLKKFKSFEKIEPVALPENFKGQLRPYQKAGLDWLCFLNQFGFGGCLADDMGLGKTIQALALLQREKEQAKKPLLNLVVAPTSVLSNWQLEAQHFTPDLKVLIHYGNERGKDPAHFESYDLVVTSYALLRRDYEIFREMQFHYVILDESQKIKNPHSQSAQVARMLKARHRLVMTGTPIENNLSELWSQFQFLNPGMLGSLKSFTQYYGTAIEKHGDKEKAEQLKRIIFPFILRRTKEQVAKELPPKSENVLYCDMEKQQANLYKKWRDYYRALILKQIDEQGMNRSKMKVLEGLTRLRQISINPAMVEENYKKDSGKFEALWNILEDVFSEGHKVLLFSQFVKALTLVREKLDKKKLKYAYLDGSTKNRQQIIDQFQTRDDLKIFLISLKAGGLGLNLTAADYVIHLDPWWNPAVESQATDRAYRIGQHKNVFVYKLITKDSVEEKILALQERKKKLADELISTDSTFFKNLERSDIELLFS